jgi:hypothetical protein
MTQIQSLIDGGFNREESRSRVVREGDIASVVKGAWPPQVNAILGPQIAGARVQFIANSLRSLRRTTQVRRIRVEGNSEKRNGFDGWSRVGMAHGIPV